MVLTPSKVSQSVSKVFQTPPVSPDKIDYLGSFLKNNFIKNVIAAQNERDTTKRYNLLEKNFIFLKDAYISTHDPKISQQASVYSQFIAQKFPQQYDKNKSLYSIACLDTSCGTTKYPAEIETLKKEISANSAIDKQVLVGILRNFESAAISADKNSQWADYLNSLSSLTAEYSRTKDSAVKTAYDKLKDFIKKNYPEIGIPKQLEI